MNKITIVDVKPFLINVMLTHSAILRKHNVYKPQETEIIFFATLKNLYNKETQEMIKEDSPYETYEKIVDDLIESGSIDFVTK
jgi:hypothetical protein